MIDRSKIFEFVKQKGPVIPRDVVKEVGGDTFLTGAFLSQMVDAKEIKISHAKIGGSPVYYVMGQEEKLDILYKYLPQKEKEAFDKLKEEKVLRDTQQEPAIRVALRSIKDFAKPLEVSIGEVKETFWKYYLVKNEEAEQTIKKQYARPQEKQQDDKTEEKSHPAQITQENKETKGAAESLPQKTEPIEKKEEKKKEEPKEKRQKKTESQETIKVTGETDTTELYSRIKTEFIGKTIDILEVTTIKKNAEIDLLIRIPSSIGKLRYFCKVKDKKKNTEKDLAGAYLEGQMKKMPVLYVTTGDLTKKAAEMLESEFKTITIMKI